MVTANTVTELMSNNPMHGNVVRIPTLKDEYVHEVITCDGPLRDKTRSFWKNMVLDQGVTKIFNLCRSSNNTESTGESQTMCGNQHEWPTRVNEQIIDEDITVSCESVNSSIAFTKVYNLIVQQFEYDEYGIRGDEVIRSAKVSLIIYTKRILNVA